MGDVIKLTQMYDVYSNKHHTKTKDIEKEINANIKSMQSIRKIVNSKASELEKYSTLKINVDCVQRTQKPRIAVYIKTVEIPLKINDIKFEDNINEDTKFLISSVIKTFNIHKSTLKNLRVDLRNQNDKVANFKNRHNFIIKRFNYLIIQKIIEGGKLHLGDGSSIYIKDKKRKYNKKVINWGASILNRKQMIEEDILPYKAIKDDNNEVIGSNGGMPWFIYFSEPIRTMVHWNVYRSVSHNAEKYKFAPTSTSTAGSLIDGKFVADETKKTFVRRLREHEHSTPNYLEQIIRINE